METERKNQIDVSKMPENIKNDPEKAALWRVQEQMKVNDELEKTDSGVEEEEKEEQKEEHKEEKQEDKQEENKTKLELDLSEFDEYEDIDTVDSIKNALKDRSLTKTERDALKKELAETKIELQKKSVSFKDKDLYKLDKYKELHPDKFDTVLKLKLSSLSPIEIHKIKFLNDNPEYAEKPHIAEKLLMKEFGIDPNFEEEDATEEEKENQQIALERMNIKAKAVKEELLSELNNISVPETEIIDEEKVKAAEVEAKETTRKTWSKAIEEMSKGLAKYPIKLPKTDEKGNTIKGEFVDYMDFEIPKEVASKCAGAALDYIVENKMIPKDKKQSEEFLQVAYGIMQEELIRTQFPYIILAAVEKGRAMKDDEYSKLYDNPSGGKQKAVKGKGTGSVAQETYEAAKAEYLKRK